MSGFPVFKRHHGVWEGTYTLIDLQGRILDQHKSRLRIEVKKDGTYFQRNTYTWPDGRQESHEFPGVFHDGALHFDTPRLKGRSLECTEDIIVLYWNYNHKPADSLAEIITLISDTRRVRTWQFIEDGHLTKLMAIEENKISDDPNA